MCKKNDHTVFTKLNKIIKHKQFKIISSVISLVILISYMIPSITMTILQYKFIANEYKSKYY